MALKIIDIIWITFGVTTAILYLALMLFAIYYGIRKFITDKNCLEEISRATQVTLSPLLTFLSKSKTLENRPHLIPSLIAAIMLFTTLANWPYGYYMLLRWAICGSAVLIALIALSWAKIWITLLFAFVSLLFNPLIPIHLSWQIWQSTDIVCALLFTGTMIILKKPRARQIDADTQKGRFRENNEKDICEIDIIKDKKSSSPLIEAQKRQLKNLLTNKRTRVERLIIVLYYYDELTIKEIAKVLELSESRVRQIHSSIIARLKSDM